MSVRRIGTAEAVAMAAGGYRLIDVRDPAEFAGGHVAGATLLPLAELPMRIAEAVPDRETPLLLYCSVGARSARAAEWLTATGYAHVVSLDAPIDEWQTHGGAWEAPAGSLDHAAQHRYARQLRLPEVGVDGQRRLLEARVMVVGAGGLGSAAAQYLAAAGVGTIGLVDDDVVDETNLQRQVLHAAERVGMAKVDSAQTSLRALNPALEVIKRAERLDAGNAQRLLRGWDVVIDGTDNLDARYLINDAAVALRIPVVHGSIYRWDGLVTTLVPFDGPCYRCLHPVRPPDGLVLDCDVAGVIGVLPGIVGTLQAAEAIKLILGAGEPLVGRLLVFDVLRASIDEIAVPRDPACSTCGTPQPAVMPGA